MLETAGVLLSKKKRDLVNLFLANTGSTPFPPCGPGRDGLTALPLRAPAGYFGAAQFLGQARSARSAAAVG